MPVKKKKISLKKKAKKIVRKAKSRPVKKAIKKSPRLKLKKAKVERGKGKKEELVGVVTHYFPHVKAAVLKVKIPLSVGERIKIKGHTTDFKQQVISMQIDRVPITVAKKGDEIGLLVESRVRRRDKVLKVK